MVKLLLQAAFLAASLPAAASAQLRTQDVTVSYADLDLSNPADVKRLDRRIAAAIRAVCPADDSAQMEMKIEVAHCHAAKQGEVAGQRTIALARAAQHGGAVALAR